jgi:hypothetical protein
VSEFSPYKKSITGRHYYCKACRARKANNKWRAQRAHGVTHLT